MLNKKSMFAMDVDALAVLLQLAVLENLQNTQSDSSHYSGTPLSRHP